MFLQHDPGGGGEFHAVWVAQGHAGGQEDAKSGGTVLETEGSLLDVASSIVGTVLGVKGTR